MRKAVSGTLLALLLASVFVLTSNIQPVKAFSGTIYIRADGSIDPSTAPIFTADNISYTLTGNVTTDAEGIVIERNNIVFNGAGYTLTGSGRGTGNGITLTNGSNVTVRNITITEFLYGIDLSNSSNNVLSGNNVTASIEFGIEIESSSGNTLSDNNVTGNQGTSIGLDSSSDNILSDNKVANGDIAIWLESSSGNALSGNNVAKNNRGIWLDSSSDNNTLSDNHITANYNYGIQLWFSSSNTFSGNDIANNSFGITLYSSSGNTLSGNVMAENGHNFFVSGHVSSDFLQSVDTSNLADGKPVYYFVNQSNMVVNADAYPKVGYIGFVNCVNVNVQGLNLTNNGQGLLLASTNDSRITGNRATNNFDGISLYLSSNNTLSDNNLTADNDAGIYLDSSSENDAISGNNITDSYYGIKLGYSSGGNTLSGNNVANNTFGVCLYSSDNFVFHNNFVDNTYQVYTGGLADVWDDGYPSGGNYWSDYNGTDLYSGQYQNVTRSDGIGDTPYVIDTNNRDNYPLMGVFSDFNVQQGVDVQVVSNSTISDFQFNGTAILFNVSGTNGTAAFCRLCVPTALSNGTLTVFVNGTQVQYNQLPSLNSNVNYLYFTYGHPLPEFPEPLILIMFMAATLLAIAIYKKRQLNP